MAQQLSGKKCPALSTAYSSTLYGRMHHAFYTSSALSHEMSSSNACSVGWSISRAVEPHTLGDLDVPCEQALALAGCRHEIMRSASRPWQDWVCACAGSWAFPCCRRSGR